MSLSPFHPPIVCSPTVTILALLSVLCMLCMLCMLYGSLPTTLLLFARAAPSPHVTSPSRLRPAHALLPVTPPCGYTSHVPCSCPPHGSASHALHHGPGSPSAAHVTAHTTPHTVTITLDTDAVTSPPRPGPHTPHVARTAHAALSPRPMVARSQRRLHTHSR